MCGLLKASYIPDKVQRELREMVGYRKKLTQTRADEVNRLQKILEGANIKISGTISDINGKTGNNLLDFIISGKKFDSDAYDEMLQNKKISTRLKASKQMLIDDMEGVISPAQRKMIEVIRNHICELEKHIKELNEAIEGLLNEEQQEAIELMCEMPGIRETSAEIIIAVIGTDMDHFPTSRHLCSWAGICPGNHESAGVRKSGRTNKGNKLLKSTLIQCAHSAVLHKDSYYYSMYRRIQAHRGKKRAIVAVAHAMLEAIYYMLKDGVVF
jgi:transposase